MSKIASFSLTVLTLLLASAWSGHAAAPYFPYEKIDNYYKTPQDQPATEQPANQQPSEPVAKPAARKGPVAVTVAPEFLFPPKLGFGVAVGVPYDMMYISKAYYYWQGGVWYRSSSYRGPWTELGYSQLPPELRKNKMATIRELRNSEFSNYWKNKENYKGKRFHPGGENDRPGAGNHDGKK